MKHIFITVLFFLLPFFVFGQDTYYSQGSGDFNDRNLWHENREGGAPNGRPGNNDFQNGGSTFIVQESHSFVINSRIATITLVIESGGNVDVADDRINIGESLELQEGSSLNLNGFDLDLGEAELIDDGGNVTSGGGSINSEPSDVDAPQNFNFSGLGFIITSSENLGEVQISRNHDELLSDGNRSINRNFNVNVENNENLNATVQFTYRDSELNGLEESSLTLFRSTDNGETWESVGGVVDTENNTITVEGVDSFSLWTAGSTDESLPIELDWFQAIQNRESIELEWRTLTEKDNMGFEVIKINPDSTVQKIGFVNGYHTSTVPQTYNIFDSTDIQTGQTTYQLRQIDFDGKITKYETDIYVTSGKFLESIKAYPNPFNSSVNVNFTVKESGYVTIKITNVLGQTVFLKNDWYQEGNYTIQRDFSFRASGTYFVNFMYNGFTYQKKIQLIK